MKNMTLCIYTIFFISFWFAETKSNELLKQIVNSWNREIHNQDRIETMTYSEDPVSNNLKNADKVTVYRNGLIGTECGRTFNEDIRFRQEFKDQYPGLFVVSHGPVNNKVAENSWLNWLKSFQCLRPMVRICGALPYAFNYEEEAKLMIQVLQHFDQNNLPVECIQTICYGFQGIICGIHALISNDAKATEIRRELNIDNTKAEQIMQNLRLIIAQAPMMRASNSITYAGIPNAIFGIQIGFIVLAVLLQRYHIVSDKYVASFGACILAMHFLKMPYCTKKLGFFLTPLVMRFIMPWLSPAIRTYQGDVTLLLKDLQKQHFKDRFPNLTLLATHQKCDEFVGPLSQNDQKVLSEVFEKTVLIESGEKDHLHESDEQKAVQHVVREKKGLAYDSTLSKKGKRWCQKNNIPYVYAEATAS